MIQAFVGRFMAAENELLAHFTENPPDEYKQIVEAVIRVLHDEDEYRSPDPERIHEIDDGDYQGTLVYVIGSSSYQPSDYWYVRVSYGSCSGCDTLKEIREYPADQQARAYWTLALHIVQGFKKMDGEET